MRIHISYISARETSAPSDRGLRRYHIIFPCGVLCLSIVYPIVAFFFRAHGFSSQPGTASFRAYTRGICIRKPIPHPSWYIQLTSPAFVYPHLIASRPSANRRPLHHFNHRALFFFLLLGRSSTFVPSFFQLRPALRCDARGPSTFFCAMYPCINLSPTYRKTFLSGIFLRVVDVVLRVKSLADHALCLVLKSMFVFSSPSPNLPKPASYIFIVVIHDTFMTAESP